MTKFVLLLKPSLCVEQRVCVLTLLLYFEYVELQSDYVYERNPNAKLKIKLFK